MEVYEISAPMALVDFIPVFLLGIIMMLTQWRQSAPAAAPPLFTGTFVFIAMMVLGLGTMC